MKKLLAVSFLSGFLLMAYEMLLPRIFSPYLGNSFALWTVVIGCILAAMSVGNWAGGNLAESGDAVRYLEYAGVLSSILFASVMVAGESVLSAISATVPGVVHGALAGAVILGVPAGAVFGSVPPLLVSMTPGPRRIGYVMAAGTLGSIAGTFAGGLWLIPSLGTARALSLLPAGGAIMAAVARGRRKPSAALTAAIAISAASLLPCWTAGSARSVVADIDTHYDRYMIVETRSGGSVDRHLLCGGVSQSKYRPDDPLVAHSYIWALHDALEPVLKEGNRILMIGGGGFSLPRLLSAVGPGVFVDVVELDGEVVRIAGEYFGGVPENTTVFTGDGRVFLNRTEQVYDAIVLDAFSGSSIPFHLCTAEFFRLAASRLTDGGLMAINFIGGMKDDLRTERFVSTVASAFDRVRAYPVDGTISPVEDQNIVITAGSAGSPGAGTEVFLPAAREIFTDRWCPVDRF